MDTRSYPFISPYKGRRDLYRQREDAKKLIDKLAKQSERLVVTWGKEAPNIGLSLQEEKRRSIPRIRWRATVKVFGHQRFLDFTATEIQEMRPLLSGHALQLIAGFEQRRLTLNARIKCAYAIVETLDEYAELSDDVTNWLPEHLREPLVKR